MRVMVPRAAKRVESRIVGERNSGLPYYERISDTVVKRVLDGGRSMELAQLPNDLAGVAPSVDSSDKNSTGRVRSLDYSDSILVREPLLAGGTLKARTYMAYVAMSGILAEVATRETPSPITPLAMIIGMICAVAHNETRDSNRVDKLVDEFEAAFQRRKIYLPVTLDKFDISDTDHYHGRIQLIINGEMVSAKRSEVLDELFSKKIAEPPLTPEPTRDYLKDPSSNRDQLYGGAAVDSWLSELASRFKFSDFFKRREARDDVNVDVNLFPAWFVERLLESSKNPDQLWQAIEPLLIELSDSLEDGATREKQYHGLLELRSHTKVSNKQLDERIASALAKVEESERLRVDLLLKMAMVHFHLDAATQYESYKESMIQIIQDTVRAEDQGTALALVDIAFDHFSANLTPQSSGFDAVAKRLIEYLKRSMRHLTTGGENIHVIYHGLRKQFPELGLPERYMHIDKKL